MDYSKQENITIIIKTETKIFQIFVSDILYIQCDKYICQIFFALNNESIYFTKSLTELEMELCNMGFIRICRNIIINAKYITCINREEEKTLLLLNNTEKFIISRQRWTKFKEFLKI